MAKKKSEASSQKPAGDVMSAPESNERVLTVNGSPIPLHLEHLIPYEKTDQGRAELEARNAGKPKARVQVIADEWDKMIAKRENATAVWDSPDPMKDAVDSVREPGMSYKFLSPRHIQKKGLRKFEIVTQNGEPVRVGDMVLGKMPEAVKERRNAHYQAIGNDDLAAVEAQYRADLERAVRDGGLSRDQAQDSLLRSGDELHDHRNPERGAKVGFRISRGEEEAA